MAETYQLFAFPAQAAARRGEWNDVAAVLDWLGSADLSCHPINAYGRDRRGSRTSSASLLASFSLISRVMQRATSITCLIITRIRFG